MNHYGQLLQSQHRVARPSEHAMIADPETFFTEIGEQVQSQITELRDRMLGSQRLDETLEGYRRRSYQALSAAEEIVLADQHLTTPETSDGDEDLAMDDDQVVASYYLRLAMIDQALADTSRQVS